MMRRRNEDVCVRARYEFLQENSKFLLEISTVFTSSFSTPHSAPHDRVTSRWLVTISYFTVEMVWAPRHRKVHEMGLRWDLDTVLWTSNMLESWETSSAKNIQFLGAKPWSLCPNEWNHRRYSPQDRYHPLQHVTSGSVTRSFFGRGSHVVKSSQRHTDVNVTVLRKVPGRRIKRSRSEFRRCPPVFRANGRPSVDGRKVLVHSGSGIIASISWRKHVCLVQAPSVVHVVGMFNVLAI